MTIVTTVETHIKALNVTNLHAQIIATTDRRRLENGHHRRTDRPTPVAMTGVALEALPMQAEAPVVATKADQGPPLPEATLREEKSVQDHHRRERGSTLGHP